jgi:leucyl-tRNA synthetase
MSSTHYNHQEIERAAQEKWEQLALNTTDLQDTEKDPYYLLVEFPYPSGDLHTGHWYAYAMPDIYARYLRMKGKNVLFPFGFDAFGLPAENAAIKRGLDPKKWTYENMDTMRAQVKKMGTSFDWSKEVVTCDPGYYRWTQWLFSKLYEQKLAERREAAVKYCPKDQTVLANEQVLNGHCERCGTEVEERVLTQWFLKITDYAKRLLTDLDPLPWREEIKDAQRAWIGESEGATITFALENANGDSLGASIAVFTTRPDTVFGVTYVVLAPEHPLIEQLSTHTENAAAIEEYRKATSRKTERERSENKEKTGVPLEGVYARNPATDELVPVYSADYVLASYGTGAVMAVPAHDERDFSFAQKYDLPIKHVVIPSLIDTQNPPQVDKEVVTRRTAIAIIRNPKNDTYLTLNWKDQPWVTFVTGGIDEGEDVIEGARREIREETGYTDIALERVLGGPMQSKYYAAHKEENRTSYSSVLLFSLVSDAREEVSGEEEANHAVQWRSLAEITKIGLRHAEMPLILTRMESPDAAYTGDGVLFDSGAFTGRPNREAMSGITEAIGAEAVTNYRLRDWLISRQRYWGCPIPVVYDPEGQPHLVPAEYLPWTLPTDVDFSPSDKSPLATSIELRERVVRIFGEGWTPEFDTLDTFVDSSWYFLRYLDSSGEVNFSDHKAMEKWIPVDRYSGGSEHTTMHLLYARFFHKALYDLALVPTPEPFAERFNRGIILGPDGQKMSKSKGNVINPDELVAQYGADAVRMYLAFIGPYNEPGSYPWNLSGVDSMRRFLDRIYRLKDRVTEEGSESKNESSEPLAQAIAKAALKVGADAERFKFNTAISTLMVLVREFESAHQITRDQYSTLTMLLAPFAPHLAEHIWELTGGEGSVHQVTWPQTEGIQEEELVTIVVQINSKKRGELRLPREAGEEVVLSEARAIPAISNALEQGPLQRHIYVPGRILNLII